MTEILKRLKVEPLVSDGHYSCHLRMYTLTPEVVGLLGQATSSKQTIESSLRTMWLH